MPFLYLFNFLDMDNSSLIGTPLPQRHRSLAPSPSPGPASTSTPNAQQSRSAALFASGGRGGKLHSYNLLLHQLRKAHFALCDRAVQMRSPLRNSSSLGQSQVALIKDPAYVPSLSSHSPALPADALLFPLGPPLFLPACTISLCISLLPSLQH